MGQHSDTGYKDIFSHPEMVRDLLMQFAGGEWIDEVDFETLNRVNGSYVSDDGDIRHSDMVWRVRLAEEWVYVYVLLEFQSEPDRWMALRLHVYVGLLYQDLVKGGALGPTGKLPPVLPIVLYNGGRRWTAATDLGELVFPSPKGLEKWQPAQRYLLIAEKELSRDAMSAERSLVAALFRLEHADTPEDMRQVVRAFLGWLESEDQKSLRGALARWATRLLRHRMRNDSIPDMDDLNEVDKMLAERSDNWADRWMRQGMAVGEVKVLRRQLERRFGPLPDWAQARLQGASEDQLIHWADAIFDAATVEQFFTRSDSSSP